MSRSHPRSRRAARAAGWINIDEALREIAETVNRPAIIDQICDTMTEHRRALAEWHKELVDRANVSPSRA